jgi:CDP-paratose 2-epimerase
VTGRALVTGSSGLVGGEIVAHFGAAGFDVTGIDNNLRADFFGPAGDTGWNRERLERAYPHFRHLTLDVRDRDAVERTVRDLRPDLIVHAAAQPSHDLAARRPFDDFDVNAVGTLNLLEAARRHAEAAIFVLLSTNKVYGDAPNAVRLRELETRWDYDDPRYAGGIDETMAIDGVTHSLFGASKLAADVLTQEYGRYFGMRTCCLRAGCLTGPAHAGVELHGFLSYLVRANLEQRRYTIYGYKGKQVRDNLHAADVARFVEAFFRRPRAAAVYNIGGGRANACSILEAFAAVQAITGRPMISDYLDRPRAGDHICYISDLSRLRADYPEWNVGVPLDGILRQIADAWRRRPAV